MSDIKKTLESYPEISFIDNLTLPQMQTKMLSDFTEEYKRQTGEEITLGLADPSRLVLYAAALQLYQAFQCIDQAGKQSFLKYSKGEYLDNLGALKGVRRNDGEAATTIERFTLSEIQQNAISIPKGTRVTAGDNVYFYTTETAEIPAGEVSVDVRIKCTETGKAGNDYKAGKISILVDNIAYIGSVANTIITDGGSEAESDAQLGDRIYLAPSSYSVAGSTDAYIYWTKTSNPGIADVGINEPSEGVVEVRFIMENGDIPEQPVLDAVKEYLSDDTIRPLTDNVTVLAPEVVNYNVKVTYYIAESNRNQVSAIQKNVENAVKAFKMWQSEKIGRDVNPSNLTRYIVNAGAKRAVITEPAFTSIDKSSVAICKDCVVTYGGVESD